MAALAIHREGRHTHIGKCQNPGDPGPVQSDPGIIQDYSPNPVLRGNSRRINPAMGATDNNAALRRTVRIGY